MNKLSIGAVVLLVLIALPLHVWAVMLLFGVMHTFLPVVPAFGFWQTVVIILLKSLLFPSFRTNKQ
jgi:hypothetical protein